MFSCRESYVCLTIQGPPAAGPSDLDTGPHCTGTPLSLGSISVPLQTCSNYFIMKHRRLASGRFVSYCNTFLLEINSTHNLVYCIVKSAKVRAYLSLTSVLHHHSHLQFHKISKERSRKVVKGVSGGKVGN